MKIVEKMAKKAAANNSNEGVTVAFLGDSVTQGCFEIYKKGNGQLETVFDKRYSYERYFFEILNILYPNVTVNIINAGISGDRAPRGALRVDRDVIRHEPDLAVVCYGLNDCGESEESVHTYTEALGTIFKKLREANIEIIFMTPNMMNTGVSPHLSDPDFVNIAKGSAKKQNSGLFDAHIDAARALCREMKVTVCDCYAIWKQLKCNGVDVTELLSNKINHPTREMNAMFAYELVRTMMTEER